MGAIPAGVAFVSAALGAAELSRRRFRLPADVTRKALHAAIGLWSIPAVYGFHDSTGAAIPYWVYAAVAYFSFRFEIFAAIEDDGPSLGSVFFPLSAGLLLLAHPDEHAYIAVCGIQAMGFGDTSAAIVGRRLGTRKYRIWGHPRTMEGSLAFFFAAGFVMTLTLTFAGGLGGHQAVAFALIAATVGASVESFSVYGLDNLTVPMATALTLWVLINLAAA